MNPQMNQGMMQMNQMNPQMNQGMFNMCNNKIKIESREKHGLLQ